MHWGSHYWGMHTFWWIFWIAIVLIALLYWTWPRRTKRRDSALETLRRTYAVGEISEEEYRRRLEVLEEHRDRKHSTRAA